MTWTMNTKAELKLNLILHSFRVISKMFCSIFITWLFAILKKQTHSHRHQKFLLRNDSKSNHCTVNDIKCPPLQFVVLKIPSFSLKTWDACRVQLDHPGTCPLSHPQIRSWCWWGTDGEGRSPSLSCSGTDPDWRDLVSYLANSLCKSNVIKYGYLILFKCRIYMFYIRWGNWISLVSKEVFLLQDPGTFISETAHLLSR